MSCSSSCWHTLKTCHVGLCPLKPEQTLAWCGGFFCFCFFNYLFNNFSLISHKVLMWILYDFFVCLRTRRSLLGPFPNFLRHLPWTSQACHCVTFPTGASMHPVTLCQPLAHVKKHLFIWYILYTNHWPIMSAALTRITGGNIYSH